MAGDSNGKESYLWVWMRLGKWGVMMRGKCEESSSYEKPKEHLHSATEIIEGVSSSIYLNPE